MAPILGIGDVAKHDEDVRPVMPRGVVPELLLFGGAIAAHDVAAPGGMGCHDLSRLSEQRSEACCVEFFREVEERRVARRQRLAAEVHGAAAGAGVKVLIHEGMSMSVTGAGWLPRLMVIPSRVDEIASAQGVDSAHGRAVEQEDAGDHMPLMPNAAR